MTEDKKSASNELLLNEALANEVFSEKSLADRPPVLKKVGSKKAALLNPNVGHRQRMKKRFLHDAASMEDYEILELLLGYAQPRKDTRILAKELLERFSNMEGVLGATPEALICAPGMGSGLTLFCRLVRECQVRCVQSPVRGYIVLFTPQQRIDFVKMRLSSCAHEEVWLATLDNGHRLINWQRISKGNPTSSSLFPRDVIKVVLQEQAVRFFLVHNHPGGSRDPSRYDRSTTEKIGKSAKDLDLSFEDHIIVTQSDCYSFVRDSMMPPTYEPRP